MCSIAGIVQLKHRYEGKKIVEQMLQATLHRGPDESDILVYPQAVIGHNRLSILDLSAAGHQPMVSDSGRLVLSYNGEIYNHLELRDELPKNERFRGHSDTEVLLKVFERGGIQCLKSLNGIFAFAVWDRQTKTLTLVRDHIGVKPLYWSQKNDALLFSSELKGLLASGLIKKELEPEAIHHLLSVQAVPAPLTMIKGVQLLPPGSYLIWKDGKVAIKRYFKVEFSEDNSLGSKIGAYTQKTHELLSKAIIGQQQSDLPLGVALSGGIDSSTITAFLASEFQENLLTFNLRSDDVLGDRSLDEVSFAKIVAQRFLTKHSEVALRRIFFLEQFPTAIWAQDQPSIRSLLAYFLFRDISSHARVVFYGTGGDELFSGYGTAKIIAEVERKARLLSIAPSLTKEIFHRLPILYKRFPYAQYTFAMIEAGSLYRQRQLIDWIFQDKEKQKLYHPSFARLCRSFSSEQFFRNYAEGKHSSPAKIHQQLDWLGIEVEHLVQLDAVSMASSVEARVPFMDKDLVSFAASLPGFVLAPGGQDNKQLLRKSLDSALPPEIINREKQGFNVGLEHYFGNSFELVCQRFLNNGRMAKRGIFSQKGIKVLMDDYFLHFPKAHHAFDKLFLLLCLEIWLEINLDGYNPRELGEEIAHIDSHAQKSKVSF